MYNFDSRRPSGERGVQSVPSLRTNQASKDSSLELEADLNGSSREKMPDLPIYLRSIYPVRPI